MRLILNIEMHGVLVSTESRQQITPDMKFTCDGMITKWIITAFAQSEENQHSGSYGGTLEIAPTRGLTELLLNLKHSITILSMSTIVSHRFQSSLEIFWGYLYLKQPHHD